MAKLRINARLIHFSALSLLLLGAVCIPQPSFGQSAFTPQQQKELHDEITAAISKSNAELMRDIRQVVKDEMEKTRPSNTSVVHPPLVKKVVVHKHYCCRPVRHCCRPRPPCWWD
jgi:5,10-methenyltetrahydromethanopterin hydrogenase